MQPLTKDKKRGITFREWDVQAPKAVVVLVHGLCAHSERWEFMADALSRVGIAAYAIDLPGFGHTEGHRGHVSSFSTYYKNILNLIEHARERYSNRKVFLCGQSMGGLIAFIMASMTPPVADGVICLSPAFKNIMTFSKRTVAKTIVAMLYRRRTLIDIPFTAEMCTRDQAYQKVLDDDPIAPRKASAQMMVNILIQQRLARSIVRKITVPLLLQVAGSDVMIDPQETRKLFRQLIVEDKTLIEYPEHAHAIAYDLGRELVFEDTIAWIARHL